MSIDSKLNNEEKTCNGLRLVFTLFRTHKRYRYTVPILPLPSTLRYDTPVNSYVTPHIHRLRQIYEVAFITCQVHSSAAIDGVGGNQSLILGSLLRFGLLHFGTTP